MSVLIQVVQARAGLFSDDKGTVGNFGNGGKACMSFAHCV